MATRPPIDKPFKLELSRRFSAPPERVFDAWLDPGSVGRWLFATPGGTMKTVEVDPRVGGRFRIDEQRGETLAEHFGEYIEIDRPKRLVFTFGTDPDEAPSLVTVEIVPADGGCALKLTHEMDAKWSAYEERIREGWTMILEGLSNTVADNSRR